MMSCCWCSGKAVDGVVRSTKRRRRSFSALYQSPFSNLAFSSSSSTKLGQKWFEGAASNIQNKNIINHNGTAFQTTSNIHELIRSRYDRSCRFLSSSHLHHAMDANPNSMPPRQPPHPTRNTSQTTTTAAAAASPHSSSSKHSHQNHPHSDTNEKYRELSRWTEFVLHPVRTPLGTLSVWNDAGTAIQMWLMGSSSPKDNDLAAADNTTTINADTILEKQQQQRNLIPRHVDMADRLLARLWFEFNCVKGSPHQQHQLDRWTVATVQAWLQLSKAHPNAPLAVDKATKWADQLSYSSRSRQRQQNHKGHPSQPNKDADNDDMDWHTILPLFRMELIQAHQRLADAAGLNMARRKQAYQTAADLLWFEVMPMIEGHHEQSFKTHHIESLKAAFQHGLRQALAIMAHEKNARNSDETATMTITMHKDSSSLSLDVASTASELLQAMEQLVVVPGWEDVRLDAEELDHVLDALFLDQNATTVQKKSLSAFERQALQQRILARIDQASTVDDQESVEDLVMYWRSNMQDTEKDSAQWKPFAKAVTSYYLRIQDPEKSTKWMQIQEQMPSAETVRDAMTGSVALRTIHSQSTGWNSGETGEDEISDFQELDALNRIFSENELERVSQKLNLLDIWLTKVKSPIVPWRATEILESLEAEKEVLVEAQTYRRIARMWIDLSTTNAAGIAGQKALDVAQRCPTFDAELFSILMKIHVDRLESDHQMGPGLQVASSMVDLFEKHYDEIPTDLAEPLISNFFCLLATHERSRDFLKYIVSKDVPISAAIADAAIHSHKSNVEHIVSLVSSGQMTDDKKLGLDSYLACLGHCLQLSKEPEWADKTNIFVFEAIGLIDDSVPFDQVVDLTELVGLVMDRLIHEHQDEVCSWKILQAMDDALLKKPAFSSAKNVNSPLLLDVYRRAIVLFSERRMAASVELAVRRLREHYNANYTDMHADTFMYELLLKMLKDRDGLESLDKRIDLWNELIGAYEASNMTMENHKPTYRTFDKLIGTLFDRSKLIQPATDSISSSSVDPISSTSVDLNLSTTVDLNLSTTVDPYEINSRVAVLLIEKMHLLKVKPNRRDRSYTFNVAMAMVLSCRNQYMHFKVVATLYHQMLDLEVEPNYHTYMYVLQACARADQSKSSAKVHQALLFSIKILTEMRRLHLIDPGIYLRCFTMFQNASKDAKTHQDKKQLDKMMAVVFQCCLDDGCLRPDVLFSFRNLAYPGTYHLLYIKHLQNGKPPSEWTRNIRKRV